MNDLPKPYLVEKAGGVLTLTLNRPEQGNSLPPSAVPGLVTVFNEAQADGCIRCILIRGEGKHFSTGGDIAGFARGVSEGVTALQADFKIRLGNVKNLVTAMLAFDRPIVAAVRGGVAGAGLLYSLAADLVIADETAFFLFAHQRMGLSPDAGVTWLLPRIVGLRTAKMMILTAAKVEAVEALRVGLVSRIVALDQLDQEAHAAATRFAKGPQHAIRTAKWLLDGALTTELSAQLDAEATGVVDSVGDPDFAEGVRSFIEKRPVRFPSARE